MKTQTTEFIIRSVDQLVKSADPLEDIELPMNVHIGTMIFVAGTSLRTFVAAIQRWHLQVQKAALLPNIPITDEERYPAVTRGEQILRTAGWNSYQAGLPCDPPGFLDGDEQRQWAIGWISGIKEIWLAP